MDNLQEKLQEKYDQIEAAITSLEKSKGESYKTSGAFRYNPTNSYSSVDIHSTTNVGEMIHAWAFIKNKSAQYDDAAADLGITEYPVFKWCGYTPDAWKHDIALRFTIIRYSDRLDKLKDARNRITPFLPQENKIKQLLLEYQQID